MVNKRVYPCSDMGPYVYKIMLVFESSQSGLGKQGSSSLMVEKKESI